MKITEIGKDIIKIDESNFQTKEKEKVHLLKLAFEEPTTEKVNAVLENYPNTNRFVISNFIKFYNEILKFTNKKYYIENTYQSLISFFKKNNKVLLNTDNLQSHEYAFVSNTDVFFDILKNTEIILIDSILFSKYKDGIIRMNWKGNVIISSHDKKL